MHETRPNTPSPPSAPPSAAIAVAVLVTLVPVLVAACGGGDAGARGWGGEVRDSAGIRLVENPEQGIWPAEGGWRLVPELSIGELDGPAEYTFFRAADVAVDEAGRIYVLDQGDKVVKTYTADGRFHRMLGREGEGPGEFREPSRMALLEDTLVVFDWRSNKLVFFTIVDGEFRREVRFEHGFAFPQQMRAGPGGTLVLGMSIGYSLPRRPENEGRAMLLSVDRNGAVLDTLDIYPGPESIPHYEERSLMVLPAPFPRAPHWDALPDGRLAWGRSDRYDIALHRVTLGDGAVEVPDAGLRPRLRMQGRVRRGAPPILVRQQDIDAYRDRWLGREDLSETMRRRYEMILRDATYPATWPAFDALRYDPAGRLWVRRPAVTGAETADWDVFDEEGRYLGAVAAPAGLRAVAVTDHAVYGLETDEYDVQYVRSYRIERPATLATRTLSNE